MDVKAPPPAWFDFDCTSNRKSDDLDPFHHQRPGSGFLFCMYLCMYVFGSGFL